MEADFSGYVTKAGLKCSDGRTIMPEAFKHMDGMTVPLVWQHGHDNPENVLGHAVLEAREDGVYGYGFFNETAAAEHAKGVVGHKDIRHMSIYANNLVERSKQVFHGVIREVSLVLSGANPGALIDYVRVAHADGSIDTLDAEAIIYTGLELSLQHSDEEIIEHAEGEDMTVQEVYDAMTPVQKDVLHFMVGTALEEQAAGNLKQSAIDDSESEGSEDEGSDEGDLAHQEGSEMTQNVFETNGATGQPARPTLTHDQLKSIVDGAAKHGSLKESFLAHAVTYGIENIDILFPDARAVDGNKPEWVSRPMEWVSGVLNGARKVPFSRIKSLSADITFDEARAKGYVKGNMKKEEWFAIAKRTTGPTTIYKKQKLDRDDIIDITDLDVVAWIKAEMRVMLDEEIARAALIGDGREVDDTDKITETNIRPIAYDDDFYTHKVSIASSVVGDAIVDEVVKARKNYKGSGNPTMYCTEDLLTDLLLIKDDNKRRIYPTTTELASALRVSNIVTVPILEGVSVGNDQLLAIFVNMSDYTFGADAGGNIGMFDDFDIDYNQYKYLIETRLSGALTKYKTALVLSRATTSGAVTPADPTFNATTGVLTIVATTGVVYKNSVTGATLATGAQTAIASKADVRVKATPAAGYTIARNAQDEWLFTRN
jgi:hypothetical protein